MSDKDLREDESKTMRDLYFLGDGVETYNSLGQQLPKDSLPEAETLAQDRIIIKRKCIGYRVFYMDNQNSTDIMPTKEIFASDVWQTREVSGEERKPTYYDYKGKRIDEPTRYSKLKENDIPWYEKVFDKTGRCIGFRIYAIDGRHQICYFNHYLIEREAGIRYIKMAKEEHIRPEAAAAYAMHPIIVYRDKNGKAYRVDSETGEMTEEK